MIKNQVVCDCCGKQDIKEQIKSAVFPIRYTDQNNIHHIDYETPDLCYECCLFILSNMNNFASSNKDNDAEFLEFLNKFGFEKRYIQEVEQRQNS